MKISDKLPKKPKKVISYSRFSSKRQVKDESKETTRNSEARQIDLAREWCDDNGYVLDEELSDKGISGWSDGNTSEKASLGKFLTSIDKGKVPKDSILIIESCSRLTRASALDAFVIFQRIISAGIHIVVLKGLGYERVINEAEFKVDPSLIYLLVGAITHSNQHSQDISDYKKRSYMRQYEAAKEGKEILTKNAPCWIDADANGNFTVCQWKAKIIKDIIKRYLSGKGTKTICNELNLEGVESIAVFEWCKDKLRHSIRGHKGNWRATTIGANIMWNRALLGEHEVKLHSKEGDKRIIKQHDDRKILTDYYPLIWSKEETKRIWAAIQDMRKKNSKRKLGRGTANENLFKGLLRCGYGHVDGLNEEAPHSTRSHGVHIHGKGSHEYRYYISDKGNRKVEGHLANSYRVTLLEREFKAMISELDWSKVCGETSSNEERDNLATDISVIEEEIAQLDKEQSYFMKRIQKLLKAGKEVPEIIEKQQDDNQDKIDKLTLEADALSVRHEELSSVENTFNPNDFKLHRLALKNWDKKDTRIALNEEMYDKIETIHIYGYGWIWCKRTFDMAVNWMPPETLAMYKDVYGHAPQWSDKVKSMLPATTDTPRNRVEWRFFEITFRNGAKRVWIGEPSHFIQKQKRVDGKPKKVKEQVLEMEQYPEYNPIPSLDRLCGHLEHQGPSYTRDNKWMYNQRAIGYELEELFEACDKTGDPLDNSELKKQWKDNTIHKYLLNHKWSKLKDTPNHDELYKLKGEYLKEEDKASKVNPLQRYRHLQSFSWIDPETNEKVIHPDHLKEIEKLKKDKTVKAYIKKEERKADHELLFNNYLKQSKSLKGELHAASGKEGKIAILETKLEQLHKEWRDKDREFKESLL